MNQPKRSVLLDTTAQVSDPATHARLQLAVRHSGISDREWPTKIQEMLLRMYLKGLQIRTQPEVVPYPLIDDIWKSDRYVREFLANSSCEHPEKDKWLLLYYKIEKPRIYRHIVR